MSEFKNVWKDSHKNNSDEEIDKMGIDAAGPVPASLLADQDLEDADIEAITSKGQARMISRRLKNGWTPKVPNYGTKGKFNCDICGAQLWMGPGNTIYCNATHEDGVTKSSEPETLPCPVCGTPSKNRDCPNGECDVNERDWINTYGVMKSVATDEKLVDLKEKAEDATTEAQKDGLVDKIKETQIKRQKATLKDRKATKSFKDFWKETHSVEEGSEYEISRPGVDRPDPEEKPDEE